MNRQQRRQQGKGGADASPDLAALLQRAMQSYRERRPGDALALARAALRLAPRRPDLLGFAGMVALEEGLPTEAARHYRAALAERPGWVEAEHGLGNALARAGDDAGAVAAFTRALARDPGHAPALGAYAALLLQQGDAAGAVASYRRAVALVPGSAELARNLGIALERAGATQDAVAQFRAAARLRPDWTLPWTNLATLAIEEGDAALAEESCDRWLALAPGTTEALAYRAIALYEKGDRDGARALVDFARFVRHGPVEPPPSFAGGAFADTAAFNRALVAHVLAHPTLKVPPADDPTYHCPTLMVSEELLGEREGPMAALEAMMNAAVADYIAALPATGSHPFLARRPRRWRLTSWCAVLLGEGVLLPHIHLEGYLSGVYYPQVPREVLESEVQAGWFELGRPPHALRSGEPETYVIRPEAGLMLLFPAYMYHRTIPFRSTQKRISIAFDVIPLD